MTGTKLKCDKRKIHIKTTVDLPSPYFTSACFRYSLSQKCFHLSLQRNYTESQGTTETHVAAFRVNWIFLSFTNLFKKHIFRLLLLRFNVLRPQTSVTISVLLRHNNSVLLSIKIKELFHFGCLPHWIKVTSERTQTMVCVSCFILISIAIYIQPNCAEASFLGFLTYFSCLHNSWDQYVPLGNTNEIKE